MEKGNIKVVVEVKGKNFKDGKAISSFEADAKIEKQSDVRVHQNDEDSITVRASDCGTPKIEANYHSKSIGEGEVKTDIAIDVKGKAIDAVKGELVDAIAAGAKLTKADAGRSIDKAMEDWFTLKAEKNCGVNCASAESFYSTKITEVVS